MRTSPQLSYAVRERIPPASASSYLTSWRSNSTLCPAVENEQCRFTQDSSLGFQGIPIVLKGNSQETGTLLTLAYENISSFVETQILEQRFHNLAHAWAKETAHLSSPTQMMMNPNYQAILDMARVNEYSVIRLMLRDMRDNRRMWFWALSYLTKENPINPTDAGKLDKMIKSWVDWGTRKGMF